MKLIILALFLASSLHDGRNQQKIHADDLIFSYAPPSADKWGIQRIYPTCDGCREWYVDMTGPENDPLFVYSSITLDDPVLDAGIWVVDGRTDGGRNSGIRMQVSSPDAGPYWHNVEMTGYVYLLDATFDEEFSWYARSGGTHQGVTDCTSGAYHNELDYQGGFEGVQKEVWHTGGYTSTHRGYLDAGLAPLLGRWVGFKVMVYDIDNGTHVQTELWEDDGNVTNKWISYTGTIDDGGWGGGSAGCSHADTDLLTGAFKYVAFRADNALFGWKYLSVREIVPPKS